MGSRIACPALLMSLALLASCGGAGDDAAAPITEAPMAAASSRSDTAVAVTKPQAAEPAVPAAAALPVSAATWDKLSNYVGKYLPDTDLLTARGPIRDRVADLLGDKFDVLLDNLEVAGPLQREGDLYYIVGNAPHEGGFNMAYLVLDPQRRLAEVGLWEQGQLTVYGPLEVRVRKPKDVQTMIDNAASGG